MPRTSCRLIAVFALLSASSIPPAQAQFDRWVKDVVKRSVENEVENQIDRVIRESIKCAVKDPMCYQSAMDAGEDVVFVDDSGDIIYDDAGYPATEPSSLPPDYREDYDRSYEEQSPAAARGPSGVVPAGYDFQSGSLEVAYEDFSGDRIGDFPKNCEFRKGDISVVEIDGLRALQIHGDGEFDLPLGNELPDQFTIEFDVWLDRHQNLLVGSPESDQSIDSVSHPYHRFQVSPESDGTGITAGSSVDAPAATREGVDDFLGGWATIRIMVDREHGKMYVDETRVANLPSGEFARGDTLRFHLDGPNKKDSYIGAIRVATGGLDLYQTLRAEGRVAVHDIQFDTDSATIRPESDDTLNQIAAMLEQHPDLKLLLEGHTDASGDFDHNLALSNLRAKAVKQWLLDNTSIDPDRLRTMGLGSTQPKTADDSDAGHEQNRRVELVKIG